MHTYSLFAIVLFPQGCKITTKMVVQDVIFQDASVKEFGGHNLLLHKGEKVVEFSDNGGDDYVEIRNAADIDTLNAALKKRDCLIRSRKLQGIITWISINTKFVTCLSRFRFLCSFH